MVPPRAYLHLLGAACLLLAASLWGGCDSSDPAPVPEVSSLSVTPGRYALPVGQTVRLVATARGAGGTNMGGAVRWRSENQAIASVSADGVVTAVSPGTVDVIAEAGQRTERVRIQVLGTGERAFNVATEEACRDADVRGFRLAATSQRAEIWADLESPQGGFTDAEFQTIGEEFDRVAWPAVVGTFGEPAGLGGNSRVLILYTRAVNELTEAGSTSVIGGFFFGRDLFPRQSTERLGACATSNEAEMFYMLVPDPQGQVNTNIRRKDDVRESTLNTLVHELQHLVNASRRLFVNNASVFEETWLDEGLSHISEELAFYAGPGSGPGQNLTIEDLRASPQVLAAANRYAIANHARLSFYYREPQAHSPFNVDDALETRGAAWQFLRYAADRRGGDQTGFFRALGNSTTSGIDNLGGALGEPPMPYFRGWAAAVHYDDAAPGIPARYLHPSWNFRSLLPWLSTNGASAGNPGTFPLQVSQLANATERSAGVRAGSAAHFRFRAASASPVRLSVAPGGGAGGGSCEGVQSVTLTVGQVHEVDVAASTALCFAGPSGAEYGVVAFHNATPGPRNSQGDRPPLSSLVVGVRADGVTSAPPAAAAARAEGGVLLRAHGVDGMAADRAWELRLRERERRELTPLIRGGTLRMDAPMVRAAGATTPLQVTVARLQ